MIVVTNSRTVNLITPNAGLLKSVDIRDVCAKKTTFITQNKENAYHVSQQIVRIRFLCQMFE